MSTSTTLTCHLSLLEYGKILRHQLHKLQSAKDWMNEADSPHIISNSTDETSEDISKTVGDAVMNTLRELKEAPDSLVQESRDHVLGRMVETLRQFIEDDPGNAKSYEQLVKDVNSFRSRMRSNPVALPPHPSAATTRSSQHKVGSSSNNYSSFEDFPFEAKYGQLTSPEKKCLLCFSLFPDGAEINKRELVNWWAGMKIINWETDEENEQQQQKGEDILHRLVENGFITSNRKKHHTYRICEDVYSKLKLKAKDDDTHRNNAHGLENDETSVNDVKVMPEVQPDKIEALLNINVDTLDSKMSSNLLSKMKMVKVVHLGKWQQHDTDYLVVKDIEELNKALKNWGQVRFLSLRGTSGVVELPDSVYKLKTLKVLDLRACHNLEVVPDGIEFLNQQLTHLDLSECYLLDGVPKGIACLTNLRVLKGFVIKPFPAELENGNKNKKIEKNVVQPPPLNEQPENNISCGFHELSSLKELIKSSIRKGFLIKPFPAELENGDKNKIEKLVVQPPPLNEQHESNICCGFHELSSLKELRKLSIRTRRMNFPIQEDLNTLCKMKQLKHLKIAWVGTSSDHHAPTQDDSETTQLSIEVLEKLKKLELQAAPNATASQLLKLISKEAIHLKKLYIRGGELEQLGELTKFQEVYEVRLRYLRELDMSWLRFRASFPNLRRLEIFGCPKLSDFPLDDDGVWENIKARFPASSVPLEINFSD